MATQELADIGLADIEDLRQTFVPIAVACLYGGAGEKLVLHKLRFHPDFVAPFSPLAKGSLATSLFCSFVH